LLGAAVLHGLLPVKSRAWFVAAVSFGFLFFSVEPSRDDAPALALGSQRVSLLLFLGWGILCYRLAPLAARHARVRYALILGLLAYLAYFKYVPTILETVLGRPGSAVALAVPIGISYFTFKLIHFLVDLGRRGGHPGSGGEFLAYLFLFPAFTAGPIERFDHFVANRAVRASRSGWVSGLTRIAVGLIKKFAVVELVLRSHAEGVDPAVMAANPDAGAAAVWLYLITWYAYVYLDFSAYTDLAIGGARLFGIELMENFNWPIFAPNIGNFWKRWHMTLAGWCQSYVYLPMIGWTRNPYVAVFATFTVIGVWHGASVNWVLWGLYHGAGVATYLTWSRWRRARGAAVAGAGWLRFVATGISTVATFLFVTAGFALSATHVSGHLWNGVPVALTLLGKCFGLGA
jgi:alginate O-acetyltransferase complex protein AlgI